MPYKNAATRLAGQRRNKAVYQQTNKRWHENFKRRTIAHYSPEVACQICGFNDLRALTIDHINGNGNSHRRAVAGNGAKFPGPWYLYRWLRENNYPEGYRVLCMNCQFITRHEANARAWHVKTFHPGQSCAEVQCSPREQEDR